MSSRPGAWRWEEIASLVLAEVLVLGVLAGMPAVWGLVAVGAALALGIRGARPAWTLPVLFGGLVLDARGLLLVPSPVPLTLAKLAAGGTLVAAGWTHLVGRAPALRVNPLTPGILLLVAGMGVSAVVAHMPPATWVDPTGVVLLGLMVHLVATATGPGDGRLLAVGMALVLVSAMAFAIADGAAAVSVDPVRAGWRVRERGPFANPNAWAALCLVAGPVALGGLSRVRGRLAAVLTGLVIAGLPLAVMQSMSRSALVVLVVVAVPVLLLARSRPLVVAVAALGAAALVPLVVNLDALALRVRTLGTPGLEASLGHGSIRTRTVLLQAGLELLREHGIRGLGLGRFAREAARVSGDHRLLVSHNAYLQVAVEQGIAGVVGHGALAVLALREAGRRVLRPVVDPRDGLARGAAVGVVAWGLLLASGNLESFGPGWFDLGLLVAPAAVRCPHRR